MNIRKSALLVSAAGLFTALALTAQAADDAKSEQAATPAFEEIDTNADGAISASEAKESWLAESFAAVDMNQDGSVSKDEYEKARS